MESLLNKKNVIGFAKGEKWTNGKPTGKEAMLVFVENKEPVSSLSKKDIIEDEIDGLPTDVVGKSGKMTAMLKLPKRTRARRLGIKRFSYIKPNAIRSKKIKTRGLRRFNPRRRTRPLLGGISVSHKDVTAGTIGGVFIDKRKKVVILSNNHVLANSNNAKAGDPIYQPGTADSKRTPANIVGYLKAYLPLRNNTNQDSAIAVIKSGYLRNQINRIGAAKGFARAKRALKVMKSGRTTGLTYGRVLATNGTFRVWYSDTKSYILKQCIVTTCMCDGGDSGSLLLNRKNRRIVGLLFAGSNSFSLHNHIAPIVKKYGLKLLK